MTKRKSTARIFWTLDAETDPFLIGREPEPFIWGAYCGENELGLEEYYEFYSIDEVVEFFERKRVVVYAHNGGKFDYQIRHRRGNHKYFSLRDAINTDEPIMVINGRLAKFRIGECEFRDSLNIFPNTRLEDFGGKIKIDYRNMEADRRSDPNVFNEIRVYLRQDCKLLWDMVGRYRREYGCGLTQAGSSMKYWSKMYKVDPPRQTKAQHDRYRPYYYGGRVQCFAHGAGHRKFSVADMNSAYPYGMLRAHMFCTEGRRQTHLPPEPQLTQCLITLDATSRGALPWRDPDDGELYFPDDEAGRRNRVRTYRVTGWELLAGLELDAIKIVNVREVYYFPQTVNFEEYINHFYNARLDAIMRGDIAGKTFNKYYMNSLYGKFGANPEHYREYLIASADKYNEWLGRGYRRSHDWTPLNEYGQQVGDSRFLMERPPVEDELNDVEGRWRYYNVATAASVTGFVRAHLFRALSQCRGLLYCDTDSIAAEDTSGLDFGTSLGQWKHEGAMDYYAIAGKKLYAMHEAGASWDYDPEADRPTWKIASKGVNLAKLPDGPQRVIDIASGGEFEFSPEVPCYSITRSAPKFIPRNLRATARDMSRAPEVGPEKVWPMDENGVVRIRIGL